MLQLRRIETPKEDLGRHGQASKGYSRTFQSREARDLRELLVPRRYACLLRALPCCVCSPGNIEIVISMFFRESRCVQIMLAYINLSSALQYSSLAAPLFAVFSVLWWSFRSYLRLRHVPGPFIAAWTNLPRLSWVLSNRAHDIHIQLHRQYGKMVRFGPNMVSISDPAEISTIYGFNPIFQKVSELLIRSKSRQVLPNGPDTISRTFTMYYCSTPKESRSPLFSQHRMTIYTMH